MYVCTTIINKDILCISVMTLEEFHSDAKNCNVIFRNDVKLLFKIFLIGALHRAPEVRNSETTYFIRNTVLKSDCVDLKFHGGQHSSACTATIKGITCTRVIQVMYF